jgi:hypothetical protein
MREFVCSKHGVSFTHQPFGSRSTSTGSKILSCSECVLECREIVKGWIKAHRIAVGRRMGVINGPKRWKRKWYRVETGSS